MAQSIACPHCRAKLFAPPDVYGQPVRCTNCARVFTASPAMSPYLDDMPPLPKDRRKLIMGGAVLASLLLVTLGLILVNWLNDDAAKTTGGPAAAPRESERPTRPENEPVLFTKDGVPIVMPREDDDDVVPGPKVEARKAKKAATLDDVLLENLRWEVAPGQRRLLFLYKFQNGATATTNTYSFKFRFEDGPVQSYPMPATSPLSEEIAIPIAPTLGEVSGKQMKVDVWIEKTIGAGTSLKVSNTVSTP